MSNDTKPVIPVKIAVIVSIILALVILPAGLYLISQQRSGLETQTKERGRILSLLGAKITGDMIEKAISDGDFSPKDIFDTDYVPIPGYDPPKFATKYDAFLDKLIQGLQDKFLKIKNIEYAIAVDKHGYLPTCDTIRGVSTAKEGGKDRINGQTKCILKDDISVNSTKNKIEGFLQIYENSAGDTMWDISSPIFVKDKHWGTFRIGFSLDSLNQAQKKLKGTLFVMLLVILAAAMVSTFLSIRIALDPLTKLTAAASEFADGKLDNKIEAKSNDEIGQIADVLERLRVSLKTAMDRLAKKT